MSTPETHQAIDPSLSGEPIDLSEGAATVRLETTDKLAADDRGLVHGGFIFSLADHAAMLAVNHPNVVLGAAETRFDAPVTVGQTVEAVAEVVEADGKKRVIEVTASTDDGEVFSGIFTAFVPDAHILDT